MTTYSAPVEDILFVLRHVTDVGAIAKLPGYADFDVDHLEDLISEAARFMAEAIAPTNRTGDLEPSRRNPDGTVTTPEGFAAAYQRYVEAGWPAAPFAPEYGGGGLPWLVGLAIQEMFTAANMALSLCPMLTQGAIHLLGTHGTPEQKTAWLPKLISGEWSGTMNLTEPQAGSDVGAITTRAVRRADGTYRITGQKIFITWGEHDMTDNIVHLTLARVPDAPAGTRGISCFIVPKVVPCNGEANRIECVAVEHKMGIHGSPTCVLQFDEAVGYLIGEENAGMGYMFTMMNNARLSVAVEGLGLADRAQQQAAEFARERRQGRALGDRSGQSAPIVVHPDVQRMLLTMRAYTEAARCLCYVTAEATDVRHHHPDEAERARAEERADLLTPIAKAWATDLGVEVTSIGLQVHGGYGYIEETGASQHFRDARITPIYEGTNGIQAIDLATRKLGIRNGGAMRDVVGEIGATCDQLDHARHADLAAALRDAADRLDATTTWLVDHRGNMADVLAGATPYLRLAGLTVGGWLLGRSALAAGQLGDRPFAAAKLATARFYLLELLPQVRGLEPAVTAGAALLASVQ
jgi:alkylation response protein AidB-like acyl-CoA dehydrogenase